MSLSAKELYLKTNERTQFQIKIEKNGYVRDFELHLKRYDGTQMVCLNTSVIQKNDEGSIAGYQGILRDITEQRRIKQELEESEELYRSIIQSMNELIFTIDANDVIQTYHPPKDSDIPTKPEAFIGKKYSEVLPKKLTEMLINATEGLQWGNQIQNFEYLLEHQGQEYWFLIVVTGHYNKSGALNGFTVVQHDITERQMAEVELRKTNEALANSIENSQKVNSKLEITQQELQLALETAKDADHLKSEFLANTSHELRTPLNSIIGFLKLVIDGLCDSPEEEHSYLNNALTSSNHLLKLINDVLDIAKIEAGKMELEVETVQLDGILDDVCTLSYVQAKQKSLYLENTLTNENIVAKADKQKLRQILLNIIGNSIKFTRKGGIKIDVIEISNREKVQISVIDTGVGIEPDKQKKVFAKFTQADGSTSREFGGTGLGLAITKNLIELMDGSIKLYSEGLGKGTTVTFTLPTK